MSFSVAGLVDNLISPFSHDFLPHPEPRGDEVLALETDHIDHEKLDVGQTRDRSDSQIHASIEGDPEHTVGFRGGAYELDGQGDFLKAPHDSPLNFDDFTIFCRVRLERLGQKQTIVSKGVEGDEMFSLYVDSLGAVHLSSNTEGGESVDFKSEDNEVDPNKWLWYGVACDSSTSDLRVFLQGEEVIHKNVHDAPSDNTEPVVFGAEQTSDGVFDNHVKGRIQRLRIYDFADTEATEGDKYGSATYGSATYSDTRQLNPEIVPQPQPTTPSKLAQLFYDSLWSILDADLDKFRRDQHASTAIGPALDRHGRNVKVDREPDQADKDYRQRIQGEMRRKVGATNRGEVLGFVKSLVEARNDEIAITENEDPDTGEYDPKQFYVKVRQSALDRKWDSTEFEGVMNRIATLLDRVAPAGVETQTVLATAATWDESTYDSGEVFGA